MEKPSTATVSTREEDEVDAALMSAGRLSTYAVQLIDYFIPADAKDSDDTIRFRLLVGLLLVYVTLISSLEIFFLFFTAISYTERLAGIVIMLPLGLLLLGILLYFRAGGRFLLCVHSMVAIMHVAVSGGVLISGGPLVSGAMFVSIIPTISAFCLAGRRVGLAWFYLSAASYGLMFYLNFSGVEFWQTQTVENAGVNAALDWWVGFVATVGVIFVYETMHERLKYERDKEHQRYVHLARYDSLTNIPNRFMFNEHLQQAVLRSERNNIKTALLYIDLDGFKPINDKLGHAAGDVVLKGIAGRLTGCLRKSDLLARLGGDEFALILEGVPTESEINTLADKILNVVSQPFEELPGAPAVTASVGIALYPDHARSNDDLISKADKAMYDAKQGKNCWKNFGAE